MKTILIITANDPNDRLAALAKEGNAIQYALNQVPRKNYNVVPLSEATTEEIIKELDVPNREIEILHYAGHADNALLRLNDVDADAQALARKLTPMNTVKLVFINGCSSGGQVRFFHQANIPFVIATAKPINDAEAAWVAREFYKYFCLGRSVRAAFAEVMSNAAFSKQNIAFVNVRGIGCPEDLNDAAFAWGIYEREGGENPDYFLPLVDENAINTEGGVKNNFVIGDTVANDKVLGDKIGGDKIENQTVYEDNRKYITYQNNANGERKIPRALTKHPFIPEVFLGREDDLSAIKQKLFNENAFLLMMSGQGGVGKTSIAATYYDRCHDLYAHTAWVLTEHNIANALLSSLAQPLGLQFENNATEAERLDILLRGVADLEKPCLLVIDNANDKDDLQLNYENLRRFRNFHLLLTTRLTKFRQAAFYYIQGLAEKEALELFKRYFEDFKTEEEPLFAQIHKAVGCNTLVIELLAKNMALFNGIKQHYSLSDMLADLQTRGLLALSKTGFVDVDYHADDAYREEKPEDIIAAMYDLSELTREEAALLSVFAVLPSESIAYDTLESLLPNVADKLEQNLLDLAQKGWIDLDKPTASFKCHPVVQEITRKKNTFLRFDCTTLIDSLIANLQRDTLHLDNYKKAAFSVRYGESVLNAFKEPDYYINLLCDGMGYYYQQVGNLSKAMATYENRLVFMQKMVDADPENQDYSDSLASTICWIGILHTLMGKLDDALKYYKDYNDLQVKLNKKYPENPRFTNGLALSYGKLGETYTKLGNSDDALRLYHEFNDLEKELNEKYLNDIVYKNGLAVSNCLLGNTYTTLQKLDEALHYYEEYNRLEKELCEEYPQNITFKNELGNSYCFLGITYTALDKLDEALSYYEQYNRAEQELYEAYTTNVTFKNNFAISCSQLGAFYFDKKQDSAKALVYLNKCAQLWLELVADFPMYVEFQNNLSWVQTKLKSLG